MADCPGKVMEHLSEDNLGLMTVRRTAVDSRWEHVNITKQIADDSGISNRSRERGYLFPLYLYPETENQHAINAQQKRIPQSEYMETVQQLPNIISNSSGKRTLWLRSR
ncbi:MAG: type ISP restriction/modification enzyme [Desulfobacterales bacterium]